MVKRVMAVKKGNSWLVREVKVREVNSFRRETMIVNEGNSR